MQAVGRPGMRSAACTEYGDPWQGRPLQRSSYSFCRRVAQLAGLGRTCHLLGHAQRPAARAVKAQKRYDA
ncbi:hypothetical protein PYCCODRAFT_1432613 [Trametes coccinea BRFM310]|uniref:Uncharacterized protein n=1 Tax=Trametes coccinea (strain BRFM310) TaxID=1353009 RepID=A0A1Y2IZS0_TRAC3|nr:hypothetical protein PYCCODRAFT_1432613 [Trametes coccinea BRFM310]